MASRITPSVVPASLMITRNFATKKTIDTTEVTSEKSKRSEMLKLLDEEVSVMKSTDINGEEAQSSSMRGEVAERFLKESQFKVTEDEEGGVVRLTRTHGDKTVVVIFTDRQVDTAQNELPDEEEEEEEKEEGEEKEEKDEKEENEEEEDEEGVRNDQPFRVEITTNKGAKEQKLLFNCYSSSDGSFIVSEMNWGDGKRIPISIGHWNEDLQRELIQWLEPLGINERLSYYIHQYIDKRTHEDNLKTLEDFKHFLANNN